MKPDVIERLLLDRALGRLDPDTDALLADYLASDASAATQARELQDVVYLAGEAVRQPVLAVEPPNQIHRLVWRHHAERALALAASFVIGVGITALVLRANLRREDNAVSLAPPIPNASMPSPHLDALVKSKIESLPFWSNQRLYLLASASAADANAKEMVK
jgi:anti-sigma factor RsiW